ncbi:MAG TPA: HK97 family phage prohead protease [Phycisphaerae bacterium]|nr:HK97 family phage prohead protease [Phycisphaerae bacterium]
MDTIERRFFTNLEVRADEGGAPKIVGYAAVFDKLSDDLGGFREKIAPGAFTRSLKEKADVRALVDHDSSRILGRTKSGTLTLSEDKSGLLAEIVPPDTTAGRDAMESIKRGDIDGMSFAFTTRQDAWEYDDDGDLRTLEDVDLRDVSVVTYPAYPDTSVAVRSRDIWKKEQEPTTDDAPIRETLKRKLRMRETT